MKQFTQEQARTVILDALLDNSSIDSLIHELYELTELPMIVFDVTFRLIAYAFPRPFYVPGWEQLAEHGNAPEALVLSSNYLFLEEKLAAGSSIVLDVASVEKIKYNTAFGPVLDGGRLIGYCAAIVDTSQDAKLVQTVNDMLCRAVASIHTVDEAQHSTQFQFHQMLESNHFDSEQASHFAQAEPGDYVLACFTSDTAGIATTNYIINTLNQREAHIFASLAEKNTLWSIGCCLGGGKTDERFQWVLEHVTEKFGYRVGISDRFSSLEELRAARVQAEAALQLAPYYPDERLFSFPEHFLDVLCLPRLNLPELPKVYFNAVHRVQQAIPADAQAFLDTLEIYLTKLQKSTVTASVLNIHKNTVNYRLQRLQEILEANLKEPRDCEQLLLELQLYRLWQRKGGETR